MSRRFSSVAGMVAAIALVVAGTAVELHADRRQRDAGVSTVTSQHRAGAVRVTHYLTH